MSGSAGGPGGSEGCFFKFLLNHKAKHAKLNNIASTVMSLNGRREMMNVPLILAALSGFSSFSEYKQIIRSKRNNWTSAVSAIEKLWLLSIPLLANHMTAV